MEKTYYDEQLNELQRQAARLRQLTAQRQELQRQRDILASRATELEAVMAAEQADVDRLEGGSLAAFFYQIAGKKEEKLSRERQEAYAARVKYDAAMVQLRSAEEDLRRCLEELAGLRGCEARYEAVLQEKAAAMKARGGKSADEILRLETRMAYLRSQQTELREARAAGSTALSTAQEVLHSLDSAEGWGTWDLFGGGLIADLAKHSKLDQAQAQIDFLQSRLRRFRTELADVSIQAEIQVNIDGFLRFADYFFDGLFADWAVLDQIRSSQEQVREICWQIQSALSHLALLDNEARQELEQLDEARKKLIQTTKL